MAALVGGISADIRSQVLLEADLERRAAVVPPSSNDASSTVPLSIVVFGGTGNLAREKLYPALYQLMASDRLPRSSTIVTYGRSAMDIDDFCAKQLVNVKFVKGLTRSAFIESLVYFQGAYDDAASFVELHEALAAREASGFNRVFFLSVPPSIFGTVCEMVSKHARAPLPGATRVLVEKPFGRDTQTFEELNALTSSAFEESEIFRVDHYLAKRCIQNLVQQRISRGVFFDEIWNNEHIASLHVSWKEDIDTGGRGGYFDQSGIIRDIMQNHLLQLFTFLTMEPSHSDTDALANKIDLLKAVGSIKMDDTFLGQFDGYLQDETVPNDSRCPTYAAARLTVDNQRWRGVPMLITAGKGLSVRNCTVEAKLKPGGAYDSILLRVQPEPGLWLRGPNGTMELPFMDAVPDTDIFDYERILFDGCRGSKLLMVGAQELREAWRIFTPLLHQIDSEQPQPVNHDFQAEQPAGMEEFARLAGVKLTAEDPLAEPSAAVMIQPKKLPQEPRVDTVQHAKSTGSLPQCKRPLTWFCTSQHLLEGKLGRALMFIQTACFLYSASILLPSGTLGGATEWSNSTVTLCPREVICAEGYTQLLMLFLSRGSAYFIYPALGSIFLTKCHAMNTWLSTTKVSLWIPLIDLHNLHAATGMLMAVMVLVHTAFHLARWAKRGELYLLFTDTAGVSGAVAVLAIIPVVVLMKLPRAMKKLVNWEIRKTAHMLSIPMAAALCFHTTRLFVFMIIVLAIYAADKIVQSFVCTHKITDLQWHRLANGVQLSFKSPAGWNTNQLGYVNVAVPWISTTQWHPFSVYAHPTLEGYSAVCINTAGDWTRALHESISKPTTRPVWIQGPFASPYATSMEFDNLLLVASGIGITPALSCMHEFGNERRLSLLWMCRDAALLQFFLQVCPFDEIAFAVVYYTGKDPLEIPKGLSSSVSIISGRPNIQEVVGELMQSMEECLPLPSSMLEASTIFKIRSELAQSWLNAAQTPLKRFEVLIENLLSAGVSAVQLMSLFGFEQGRSSVEAECFERTLRRFGVSEEVFSSQEIDDVYNGLDTDGDGTIDRCEMHFFLSRLHHTGEGGGTHQLRDFALRALKVSEFADQLLPDSPIFDEESPTKPRNQTRLIQRGHVIGGLTTEISLSTEIVVNGISRDDVQRMQPFFQLVQYEKHEHIMKSGDPSDGNMYVLSAGSANVVVNGNVVHTLAVGDRFGEPALWEDKARNADIVAQDDDVRCLTFARDRLNKLSPDTIVRMKSNTYETAVALGGMNFAPIKAESLHRLCALKNNPGLRATFREWDLGQTGILSVDDVHRGLSKNVGEHSSSVLLVDIIMDGKPTCDYDEFKQALDILTRRLELAAPAKRGASASDDEQRDEPIRYVKGMPKSALDRWGMLYCGGAAPVVAALEKTSREFQISYKAESFQW